MSQTSSQTPQENSRLREALGLVKHLFLNNWGTKLLSLLLAVGLWAGLITQDPALTREKNFTSVSVTVSGEESLKRNGFIVVSDLDTALTGVSLSVDVPQMQYNNAQATNYNVRMDLSRIRSAGEQDVRIMTTNSSTYGTVTSVSPATVTVTVDEYITRYRIPVSVVTTGQVPEGYYAAEPSLDPPMLAVSGPRTVVDRIARAEAVVDLSTLPAREGTVRRAVSFTLLDENNNPIESDLLEVTSESVLVESVVVEQKVYGVREIELAELGLVRGTPANGYEVKGVYITPATVTVAGSRNMLDTVNVLYLNSYVNVSGLSESVNETVYIRQPSGLKYISTDEVTVAVEIGPVITSKYFEDIDLTVENVPQGLQVHTDITSATVTVTGPQLWIKTLYTRGLNLYCDASGLTEGVHELPLMCRVRQSDGKTYTLEIQPATVQVTLTAAD